MTRSLMTLPHPNIGPRGCKRRGTMGWVWLALGIAIVVTLVARRAPTGWSALAAVPFLLAALGFFQAREQTCVFFAAFGQRDLDEGAERIVDATELARVREQAARVWLRAIIATVGLTALALVIAASIG